MDNREYFKYFEDEFNKAFSVAEAARKKGYDPDSSVEIKPAPDIASRVEGLIAIDGIAEMIRAHTGAKTSQELAFDVVKQICTSERFAKFDAEAKLTIASRVGLSILTEGVVVAATEGIQGVEIHKTPEGSDYAAILFAGPIRSAGGTSAALSVAFCDYGRRLLNIGAYKASQSEVERYIEEIQLYNVEHRLQYYPPENDIREIIQNCPVCIDGLPTEQIEMSVHRNMKRLDKSGKEQMIPNRIRGGTALVSCEGIAQKAKSVVKHTKNAGLDWSWLNNIIKVDKGASKAEQEQKNESVFLQELVAGRPILAYPGHTGAFRLRYGRSRLTGIAAKGFSPATMIILDDYIACGTQLKLDKPGKGCIASPVDSIEGPFVKLKSGEALRINSAEQALEVRGQIEKILSVGDMLVTFGDFKKSNTPLLPTSYVEEYWIDQLKSKGADGIKAEPSFREAFDLSKRYGVPMHPRYIYDFAETRSKRLADLAAAVLQSKIERNGDLLFDVKSIEMPNSGEIVETLEEICIPHFAGVSSVIMRGDDAQSILASLGLSEDGTLRLRPQNYQIDKPPLEMLNAVAPFKIMKRSTRLGARIGRPEKARERLMKPAPNILFPIGEHGSKERNLYKAYNEEKRKFGSPGVELEVANYKCSAGKEPVSGAYCAKHNAKAEMERVCRSCGRKTEGEICRYCGGKSAGYSIRNVNIVEQVELSMKNLGVQSLPKGLKGVKGLMNRDKIAEPIEKGILRSIHNVHIFKDGTSRFDATDAPMTHFYPDEISTGVERLRELGYTKDYLGNELVRGDQLVELKHQDMLLNRVGAEGILNVAKFIDDLLKRFYKIEPFYNAEKVDDLVGKFTITLAPHTSAGVLCRIIGFTDATVGYCHPYVISARRRNCDGDEDTTILLLDALINFSRSYLPTTIGGTMDAPLILTVNVKPDEVDDEVHDMETLKDYGVEFYDKTFSYTPPTEIKMDRVGDRLKKDEVYHDINFTHLSGIESISKAPHRSSYTMFKSMQEKVDAQFRLMDRLYSIDRPDTARRLILSHFIPDLIGNMHSFSKQGFRCVACNAKYRRVPLIGKCIRCNGGKLVLTISKGSIEKYLSMAIELSNRYNLEPYIKQRLLLVRDEINNVFGGVGSESIPTKQFNLAKFL